MPKLSLYRPEKANDYSFLDKTASEMFTTGGVDIYVHKYLGPKTVGDSSIRDNDDVTRPVYNTSDPLFIEDLLFLENRDREYDDSVYTMRGVYQVQNIDFDLTQFGLFMSGDTQFVTFHYNDMINTFGRKLMAGDVLEFPNLKDYHPLDTSGPKALPRYYVVQDASFDSEGFSQTWYPHLWRVKATPLTSSQEYDDILNKPLDPDNPSAGTIDDFLGTRKKDLDINDTIVRQAEIELPASGYDNTGYYITPTAKDAHGVFKPVNTQTVTSDGTSVPGKTPEPQVDGYLVGYLTGDAVSPNGLNVTPGVTFPSAPGVGDYALRLDYSPNRLFRYDGSRWVKVEDGVRTDLTPGSGSDERQLSGFTNNDDNVTTSDRGTITGKQSLSDLLSPKKDN